MLYDFLTGLMNLFNQVLDMFDCHGSLDFKLKKKQQQQQKQLSLFIMRISRVKMFQT